MTQKDFEKIYTDTKAIIKFIWEDISTLIIPSILISLVLVYSNTMIIEKETSINGSSFLVLVLMVAFAMRETKRYFTKDK